MRVLVTGGAGFLGSHLCGRLVAEGHEVICLDSLLTAEMTNISSLIDLDGFTFQKHDVTNYIAFDGNLDWVLHFASPASPVDYLQHPIHTLKVGALGTLNGLGLAKAKTAGFFLASTSEVYGDPLVNPQPETYWGNVNSIGPRGVYDEAKRFAEAMTYAYKEAHGIAVRVARIFNTYGPRMRRDDGRAVPTFISQALTGEPLTVHGDGTQTRSLCFVEDTIEAFVRLLYSDVTEPVNIGNPHEVTIVELAQLINGLVGSGSDIKFIERPTDDPDRRRPDISRAMSALGWTPEIRLEDGLRRTLEWCKESWL